MKKKAPVKKKAPAKTKAIAKVEAAAPVVQARAAVEVLSEAKILEAFDMLGITSRLKDERSKRLFLEVAKMHNLNPLKKEIHPVQMYDSEAGESRLVPVIGYEVYIDRAEASGRLEWWTQEEKGTGEDFGVTVTVKRKDWPRPFSYTAYYKESVRRKRDGNPNVFWKERPHHMTFKCAVAATFRLIFRDILRGLPFIAEEVQASDEEVLDAEKPLSEPKEIVLPTGGMGYGKPPSTKLDIRASGDQKEMAAAEESLKAAEKKLDAALAEPSLADQRKAQEEEAEKELKLAKEEVQAVYSEIVKENKVRARPYTKEELKEMMEAAVAAGKAKDVQKLQNMVIDWQVDAEERSKE